MVPVKPPNTHPRPHLMPKEPTNFLILPRCGTILGFQNVTLYCKLDTVIQLFQQPYKWSLAQGLHKTLDSLFLYPIEPKISTPEKLAFCTQPWATLNPCISATNQDFEKYKRVFSLGSLEYTTKVSIICLKHKLWKWPGRTIGTFDFTCRSWATLNPYISANK